MNVALLTAAAVALIAALVALIAALVALTLPARRPKTAPAYQRHEFQAEAET
jgi:hypothetical protein